MLALLAWQGGVNVAQGLLGVLEWCHCCAGSRAAVEWTVWALHGHRRRWECRTIAAGWLAGHRPTRSRPSPPLHPHVQAQCDAVAVVSATADVQRQRVMARPGMTEGKRCCRLQPSDSWPQGCSRCPALRFNSLLPAGTSQSNEQMLHKAATLRAAATRCMPLPVLVQRSWRLSWRGRCRMRRSGGEQTL